jgi:hypothetical protein
VLLAIAACVLLQVAYTHVPVLQRLFGSAPLDMAEWARVVAAGILVFLVAEAEKAVWRHWHRRTPTIRSRLHERSA